MRRSIRIAAVAALLAACDLGDRSVTTAASMDPEVAPSTCGGGNGPVPSALALAALGGGCYPSGISAAALEELLVTDPQAITSITFTTELLQQFLQPVDPEWAPVVNGFVPVSTPVIVHGTVRDSLVSTEDFPSTHLTVDQNTHIILDANDSSCLATGNLASSEEEEAATLELEWETVKYPAWAWAGPGDRIVALGRWIFDCGHPNAIPGHCSDTGSPCFLKSDCGSAEAECVDVTWNYRSELHPPQAVAVIRTGRGAPMLQPGSGNASQPIRPVTRADIFVSGDGGGAADACVVAHYATLDEILGAPCFDLRNPLALLPENAPALNSADFGFDVPLPPAPNGGVPFWRIESRPTPSLPAPFDTQGPVPADIDVTPVLGPDPHLHVVVRMTRTIGDQLPTGFAGTLFAGWRQASVPLLTHVRVALEGLAINDPLKFPLPLDVPTPNGWRAEASVDGEWQTLDAGLIDVATAGFVRVAAVFDQWLSPQGHLLVHAHAASLGCQDTIRGQRLLDTLAEFHFDYASAALCLFAKSIDAGDVDADFAGPDFGASGSPYTIASSTGAYALQFRIERVVDNAVVQR